jgi:DNA-binding NarL/FixJ family response regulator
VTEFVLDDYLKKRDPDAETGPAITPREREIIQLVAEGKSSKEVAAALQLSVKTVEAHRANIMRKLRINSVTELVRYAIRNGIAQP